MSIILVGLQTVWIIFGVFKTVLHAVHLIAQGHGFKHLLSTVGWKHVKVLVKYCQPIVHRVYSSFSFMSLIIPAFMPGRQRFFARAKIWPPSRCHV
jgi:hypothetical protein